MGLLFGAVHIAWAAKWKLGLLEVADWCFFVFDNKFEFLVANVYWGYFYVIIDRIYIQWLNMHKHKNGKGGTQRAKKNEKTQKCLHKIFFSELLKIEILRLWSEKRGCRHDPTIRAHRKSYRISAKHFHHISFSCYADLESYNYWRMPQTLHDVRIKYSESNECCSRKNPFHMCHYF